MLFVLIIFFLVGEYVLLRYLDHLNNKRRGRSLPEELTGIYDNEKYSRSQEYDKAKNQLTLISSTFNLLLILAVLFLNGFAFLDRWTATISTEPVWQGLLFFTILFLITDLINLPFSIYSTFTIEERFEFNKTTPKTFILDKIKGYFLGGIIGGGILALIILFYIYAGDLFWVYTWVMITIVSLFFITFYTSLIVPIFNKLSPIEEGPLKEAIKSFCTQAKFPLKNIYTIDGSKRSAKSNAYFSGIGAKKSIVLFDTLVTNHTIEEIVAILAHEIGHNKKKHVQLGFILSALQMGILLYLLSWLIDNPLLAQALHADKINFHLGLLVFTLLYSPISIVLGIFMNILSRKNEYQADNFAKTHYEATHLVSALKKLSTDNLSNLTPHPLYVFFHYSHPPLLQRIQAIKE